MRTWCGAWARSRGLSPPERIGACLRTIVGQPNQKERYVFPRLEPEEFRALAHGIDEPFVFLKVCAPEPEVSPLLPLGWQTARPRYMMAARLQSASDLGRLPAEFALSVVEAEWGHLVLVSNRDGQEVGRGGLVIEHDIAVFDRVITQEGYRRLGVATAVMVRLEELAMTLGAQDGLLVATAAGRHLYASLGWETLSDYTTAVIPA